MNKEEEVIYGYEIEMKKEEHNIRSSNLDYNQVDNSEKKNNCNENNLQNGCFSTKHLKSMKIDFSDVILSEERIIIPNEDKKKNKVTYGKVINNKSSNQIINVEIGNNILRLQEEESKEKHISEVKIYFIRKQVKQM